MKMTAREILNLGVIDEVVEEPLGGAHHDYAGAAANLKQALVKHLKELQDLGQKQGRDAIRRDRQNKFRLFGAHG